MADLTTLESKLGEVVGLAMAEQEATRKVLRLPDMEDDLEQRLEKDAGRGESGACRSSSGTSRRRSRALRALAAAKDPTEPA